MIISQRNTRNNVLALRFSFLILMLACLGAFTWHYSILGYVMVIILLTLSIVVVKDFMVTANAFRITQYYCFGFFKKTWHFNKGENIRISSFDPDFGQDADMQDTIAEPEALGCLWTIFSAFIPSKITKRHIKIEKLDEAGKPISRVGILLSSKEFNYIQQFIE
jgi:hypothetical protein